MDTISLPKELYNALGLGPLPRYPRYKRSGETGLARADAAVWKKHKAFDKLQLAMPKKCHTFGNSPALPHECARPVSPGYLYRGHQGRGPKPRAP